MIALALAALLAPAQDAVAKLIADGDAAWAMRDHDGQPARAVESYKKALAVDDRSAEASWKIARVAFWTGQHEKDPEKVAAIYRDAIDYAKLAIDADADCVPARFWLALLYGLFGQAKGIVQSLHLVGPMKKELEWVVEHDEKFEAAGAHRVLGMLYHKLPGINGGDDDQAEKHLRRAVELAPGFFTNHFLLAQVLADRGKKDEARKILAAAMDLKDGAEWGPELKEDRAEAKKLLEALSR